MLGGEIHVLRRYAQQSKTEGVIRHELNLSRILLSPCFSRRLFAAPARAEEVKAGDLVITQAWSRATPSGAKIAGGYLTIENKGTTRGPADRRLRRDRGQGRGPRDGHEQRRDDDAPARQGA